MSLTLRRTPKYERFLPAEERGVTVSHELFPDDDEPDFLRRIEMTPPLIKIETTRRQYEVDISRWTRKK